MWASLAAKKAWHDTKSRLVLEAHNAAPHYVLHDLRHVAITNLNFAGVYPALLTAAVGHSDFNINQHYTHVDDPTFNHP